MILKTDELKNACTKILSAVDNNGDASLVGRLELKSENGVLFFNVTNGEYFVEVKLGPCDTDFHATINADLFLKLVSQITATEIEISVNETTLFAKTTSGDYKFPLIYDGDSILVLPKIIINNPTINMNIDGNILNSILINNSKELSKVSNDGKVAINPVQRLYYVDEQGAITFVNGACVNKFTLEKPVKMLLNTKIVKLFSLFKKTNVTFEMGYDALSEDIIQTKVKFNNDNTVITAILSSDDTLIKAYPAASIRDKAFTDYNYTATINRVSLLECIQRLMLFTMSATAIGNYKTCGKIIFKKSGCTVSDYASDNIEEINYANSLNEDVNYEALFDLKDIKLALENNKDQYITIGFGNNEAIVIAKDNVYTVIPEFVRM